MHDLRSFVTSLEKRGELVRIRRPVDSRFELAAVMTRLEAAGKAFVFEQVRGARYPLVGGLFSRVERFGAALGRGPGGFTHADMEAAIERAKAQPIAPVEIPAGACHEVIHTGDSLDLRHLPVPWFFERDSGPFITAGVGVARHPHSGVLNVGFYRTLILGRDSCAINASSLSDLRRIYEHAAAHGGKMPIALAIGVEPALLFAAACKLPTTISEIDVAGGLKGAPIEVTRALTSDLLVPANAEFVIEGTVDLSQRCTNVLGEYAGQYGPESAPVTRITAITRRREPLFCSILAGRNPEHNTLGKIATYGIKRDLAARLLQLDPCVRRVNIFSDPRLGPMVHVAIAIAKQADDQPAELIRRVFSTPGNIFPVSRIARRVIIVDEDVDVDSIEDVEWAIWSRLATPEQMVLIPGVESWELDRVSRPGEGSLRVGIDATMRIRDRDALARPCTPGFESIRLEDYLDGLV